MKLKSLIILMVVLSLSAVKAQQAMWGGDGIVSPEIHDDRSVTFRLAAANAEQVKISGDWMPYQGWLPGSDSMTKDEKGIWTYTTAPLESELYTYSFSVDDLRMSDPNNPFLQRDVASVTNLFIVGGGQGDLYKVNDIAHGTISKRWYNSAGLKMDRRITVYTPPGYEASDERYPVLYLLHGAGGDEEAWMTLGRASQILDNLIARGEAKPMIVVMPNANVIQDGAPGEGSDGFYKPQFMVPKTMDGTFEEHYMEIIDFVESNYKVKADKAHRAIAGLSMGGFHTIHISRYYPNTFDYIGPFSAALMLQQGITSKVYKDIDETLKAQKEAGYKLYWIAIGKEDFLYQNNLVFKQKLDAQGLNYTFTESEGGHVWKNWRSYLSKFLPLLF